MSSGVNGPQRAPNPWRNFSRDYEVFLKETNENPKDWDLALCVQHKNHAALDGLAAKGEAARDKILGGKQQAQQLGQAGRDTGDPGFLPDAGSHAEVMAETMCV